MGQLAFKTACAVIRRIEMKARASLKEMTVLFTMCIGLCFIPNISGAHCDTLEGPVVTVAKVTLEKGDVTPILKWIRAKDEKEVKDLFNKTLVVRKQSKEAKELADMYFFETLVRIHRAGEGAPYTGLKREPVEPIIGAADKALESGTSDNLIKLVDDAVANGIRERFEHTKETKKHADESIEAGRKFVEAYVEFTHYVERLHLDATTPSGHAKEPETAGGEGHRHH
jgi:hypothetical protein